MGIFEYNDLQIVSRVDCTHFKDSSKTLTLISERPVTTHNALSGSVKNNVNVFPLLATSDPLCDG